MKFKPTISEVLEKQKEYYEILTDSNRNHQWPDKNPDWIMPEYFDEEDMKALIEEYKEMSVELEKVWSLDELKIDTNMVLLQLSSKPEDWILGRGFKPGDDFILLGEVKYMYGHVVVVSCSSNEILTCVHSFNFNLVPYYNI